MNRYLTNLCVVLVLFAAVTSASATSYPGYTCTELVGLTYGGGPNAWAGTLLPNGTVIGGTEWAGRGMGPPTYSLCTWTSSGAFTNVYTADNPIEYVWGDNAGHIVADQQGAVYVWNGTTYAETGNSNLNYPTYPGYVSSGGLVCGFNSTVTVSWAYNLNTGTYYSVSTSSRGRHLGDRRQRRVRGGQHQRGRLPLEGVQPVVPHVQRHVGLNSVSENGQYIAAVTTGGRAALYSPSGTLLGSYWNGEATFVNDNGLVVGDTTTIDGGGGNSNPQAMAYINGQTVNLTTAYAPGGVTFKACDGVNDAGQILVSNSYSIATGVEMWLLTPTATPEPSTLLLAGIGLLGLTAYAWRKRK